MVYYGTKILLFFLKPKLFAPRTAFFGHLPALRLTSISHFSPRFVACNSNHEFVVDGTITNAENGEMICLSYPIERNDIWYKQCDTTYLNGGHFRFEGKVDGVVPAELTLPNMDCVQLFLESSNIKFNAECSTLYDYSLSGLSIDNELNEYRKAFAAYDKAILNSRKFSYTSTFLNKIAIFVVVYF